MKFLRKVFRIKEDATPASSSPSATTDPLVENLTSDDETAFLRALTAAIQLADSGNCRGLYAMREAMRVRSGKRNVHFYRPAMVATVGIDRYIEARDQILSLVKENALLDNPHASGNLIAAFQQISGRHDLRTLLSEIYAIGGPSEGFAFQLLFNEIRCSARQAAGMD